jgi:hypothetical protein
MKRRGGLQALAPPAMHPPAPVGRGPSRMGYPHAFVACVLGDSRRFFATFRPRGVSVRALSWVCSPPRLRGIVPPVRTTKEGECSKTAWVNKRGGGGFRSPALNRSAAREPLSMTPGAASQQGAKSPPRSVCAFYGGRFGLSTAFDRTDRLSWQTTTIPFFRLSENPMSTN